jgi:hypothetical protein
MATPSEKLASSLEAFTYKSHIIYVSVISLLIVGCNTKDVLNYKFGQCYGANGQESKCLNRPTADKMTPEARKAAFEHEPWYKKHSKCDGRPLIGIASSGGGSKASSFGFGVIKALVDSDRIKNIDIISSVSGGGYAAIGLYSRINHVKGDAQKLKDSFSSEVLRGAYTNREAQPDGEYNCNQDNPCVLAPSLDFFHSNDEKLKPEKLKPEEKQPLEVSTWYLNTKSSIDIAGVQISDDQFLHHGCDGIHSALHTVFLRPRGDAMRQPRCYPDIMHLSTGSKTTRKIENKLGTSLMYVGYITAHISTIPISWITNTLFDLPVNISPTNWAQQSGIFRQYASQYELKVEKEPKKDKEQKDKEPQGNWLSLWQQGYSPITMEDVKKIEDDGYPMWIVNATTPTSNALNFSSIDLTKMDQYRMEFTSRGFGSHKYGYVINETPDTFLDVPFKKLVTSSQAFLDPRQRTYIFEGILGSKGENFGLFIGSELLNLNWSLKIPNYTMHPNAYTAWQAVPFPFIFNRWLLPEEEYRPHIHLGDGGVNRDNWGIIPLLERGTRHIIALDQSDDIETDQINTVGLQNLCEINQFLNDRGVTLEMTGNPNNDPKSPYNLKDECNKQKNSPTVINRLNYKEWKKPVWEGEIVCDDKNKDCSNPMNGIKLYVVKATVDRDEMDACWNNVTHKDQVKRQEYWAKAITFRKSLSGKDIKPVIPPTLCLFEYDQRKHCSEDEEGDCFPQHSMAALTFNMSNGLWNGYMELGWYKGTYLINIIDGIIKKEKSTIQ